MSRSLRPLPGVSWFFSCLRDQRSLSRSNPCPSRNFVDSVYPFLGVDWGGNTFVGAALPFGMVKVGPDMESFDGRQSGFGYWTDGRILGFSQTHLSGAQGKYGNILVMPVTGALALDDIRSPRTAEVNHPGYYATRLTRYHDFAELTSTRRVALHRYTFSTAADAHITVNISHCLGKGSGSESQRFVSGEVHFVSNREVEGVGRYAGGWNKGGEYTVYFDMVLDTPAMSTRTWTGSAITSSQQASVDHDLPLGATLISLFTQARSCKPRSRSRSSASIRHAPRWSRRLPAALSTRFAPLPRASGMKLSPKSNSTARRTPSASSSIPRCTTPC